MPQRTKAHVTGDIALNRVIAICNACGWAADPVISDYGEDLVVQPFLNGIADPFRILIQVKGTDSIDRHRTKRHGISLLLPKAHVRKWSFNQELTMIVLWDINKDLGFFAIPRNQFSDIDFLVKPGKLRICFDDSDVYSKASLEKIAWGEALDTLDNIISKEQNKFEAIADSSKIEDAIKKSLLATRINEFLKVSGVIEEHPSGVLWRVTQEVKDYFYAAFMLFIKEKNDLVASSNMAFIAAVLVKLNLRTGHGIRQSTLFSCLGWLQIMEPFKTFFCCCGFFRRARTTCNLA